jgi:L,D-transpeptidase catalytic domain
MTRSERRRSRRVRRRRALLASVVILGVATAVGVALMRHDHGAARVVAARWRLPGWITPWTALATLPAPTPGYLTVDAATPVMTVTPTWAGAPVALPVLATVPGWLRIGLVAPPWTPTAVWIRAAAASLTRTTYQLVVDTTHTRLLAFRDAQLQFCAPAGLGAATHPTPLGRHFVVHFAQAPSPRYGPFVIVTSAYSDASTDWQQGGRPIVTIEGPLDSAPVIGTTGARFTTGAVRLLDQDLAQLRAVPAGTPVDVVADLQLERSLVTGTHHHHHDHRDAVDLLCSAGSGTTRPLRPVTARGRTER